MLWPPPNVTPVIQLGFDSVITMQLKNSSIRDSPYRRLAEDLLSVPNTCELEVFVRSCRVWELYSLDNPWKEFSF